MNRLDKFEHVLFRWGAKVLIDIRYLAEEMEWYEDCAEINQILEKHGIDTNFNTEDWISEFWKMGYSGKTVLSNSPLYYLDAVNLLYGEKIDEITAPYKHIKVNLI